MTKNLVTGLDYGEDIAMFMEIIENYISKNQVRDPLISNSLLLIDIMYL